MFFCGYYYFDNEEDFDDDDIEGDDDLRLYFVLDCERVVFEELLDEGFESEMDDGYDVFFDRKMKIVKVEKIKKKGKIYYI